MMTRIAPLTTKSKRSISLLVILILCIFGIIIYSYYPRPVVILINTSTKSPHFIHPYIAVLVEFRSTPLLVTIVMHVLHNIPADWPMQIFHGKENLQFLRDSQLSTYINSSRIILQQIDPMKGNAMDSTSDLLTNSSFWQLVKGEKILFFQLDSVFCSNSPHKLKDFLKYDYVGAPWHSRLNIPVKVGNGGFSLRSRSKLLELLSNHTFNHQYHEDVWFSNYLPLVNGTIPSEDIAKTFSVETIFYATPLAVHKPIYLTHAEMKALCQACPELRLIRTHCT